MWLTGRRRHVYPRGVSAHESGGSAHNEGVPSQHRQSRLTATAARGEGTEERCERRVDALQRLTVGKRWASEKALNVEHYGLWIGKQNIPYSQLTIQQYLGEVLEASNQNSSGS